MSKTFTKISLGVLLLAGTIAASQAVVPGTGMKTLSGNVPSVVSQLTPVKALPSTNVLHLAIGLPVSNPAAMETLLQQMYDPASTNYHKYLTPAEFASRFGASQQDYQAVTAFAQANGLTVTATHSNRLILDVSGTAADIEKAFQVNLMVYNHPTESRTFFAPASNPVVSSSLPILHVSGLNNYYLPHPQITPAAQNPNADATPKTGSGPGGAYLGADFRKAYVPGTTLTGAGQSVGLLQFDGFYASDIASYVSIIGLTNPPSVVTVPVNGGVSVPGSGNGEVCLDIEMIMAMAPGVSHIYVYEAPNPSPWVDLLSRMADDDLAKQLSCSWGGGLQNPSAEQIFKQMALQGQSFYNAVGDGCAFVPGVNPVEFPEDSPNITQVGGTTLTSGQNAAYSSERVWNWGYPNPNGGYWGSCGGISTYYSIPAWQKDVSMANNHGSTTMRNMPDVALTADNIYVTYGGGAAGAFGGTSCAAPLWAAFTALVNQQAAINGQSSVGFVNPALYSLAKTSSYTNYFHDVTVGDNTWPGSPTNFFAVPGYDLCTGLGTPNGTNLINALAGTPAAPGQIISAPLPPWGTQLSNLNGSNPNGPWFLFIQDDKLYDVGIITNGWSINLTMANPVANNADNQLYMTPTNSAVVTSNAWTVNLTVTNYGPSFATNVYVSDTLPGAGVALLSYAPTAGSVQVVGNTLTWTLGDLAMNQGAGLTLQFQATATGSFTNTAQVFATTSDPNPDDDGSTAVLTVNTATAPVLSSPSYMGAGAGFQFSVSGDPGTPVTVQSSTNLVDWVNVYNANIPVSGNFIYTNLNTSGYPQQFYRVTSP